MLFIEINSLYLIYSNNRYKTKDMNLNIKGIINLDFRGFKSGKELYEFSKNGDNFGNGEIEGVAAAESGNNGTAGATLIPLLALGIPGDITTAIILGAFMIHGLRPGPLLFQDNLSLIYALFIGTLSFAPFGYDREGAEPNPII